jgi:hypothetical protein
VSRRNAWGLVYKPSVRRERPIFASTSSGYTFLLGVAVSVCGRTTSEKSCKEPKSELVTEISSHKSFFLCLQLLRGRWMSNSNHGLELTMGIIIVGRRGRSCHMRNRDPCRQLRLGKNRSQQLVSIDLCFYYVYRLTCEKVGDCKCLLPIRTVSARGLVLTV